MYKVSNYLNSIRGDIILVSAQLVLCLLQLLRHFGDYTPVNSTE